jgi:hypothetical protein
MCDVPLDLQRRFEQRWAARFAPRVVSARPKRIVLKRHRSKSSCAQQEKKKSSPAIHVTDYGPPDTKRGGSPACGIEAPRPSPLLEFRLP